MKTIRAIYRLFAFFFVTFFWAVAVFVAALLGASSEQRFMYLRRWSKNLVRALRIEIEYQGELSMEPGIIMANHRSYVDILLFPLQIPMVFVAKAEVQKWPVLGWGAKTVETVFVNREKRESRANTRVQLTERLKHGRSVIIFPEGTTGRGPEVLPLKPGMFNTIAQGDFPVHPVAIEYQDQDMAWIGDDTFFPHFIEHFGRKRVRVKVRMGEIMRGDDSLELKRRVTDWMNVNLLEMRQEWDTLGDV